DRAGRDSAVKDVGLLGALALTATEPRRRPPKVVHDARHAARDLRKSAVKAGKSADPRTRGASAKLPSGKR
ncbi:hypothetical protein ACFQZU_19790, partial [Streptomonospora algeriensis]